MKQFQYQESRTRVQKLNPACSIHAMTARNVLPRNGCSTNTQFVTHVPGDCFDVQGAQGVQ